MSESLSQTERRSAGRKRVSSAIFPEKLYRLISSATYCSIWWSEDGTHFVVDVPKFQHEVLRSPTIPRSDGFNTICFTSFVRQLNMYGFRKVELNGVHLLDPRDWQRYAHVYFLRSRIDCLANIQRHPGRVRRALTSAENFEEMRRYDDAVELNFQSKGLRLSRTGPKKFKTNGIASSSTRKSRKTSAEAFAVPVPVRSDLACNFSTLSTSQVYVPDQHAAPEMQVHAMSWEQKPFLLAQDNAQATGEEQTSMVANQRLGYTTLELNAVNFSHDQWKHSRVQQIENSESVYLDSSQYHSELLPVSQLSWSNCGDWRSSVPTNQHSFTDDVTGFDQHALQNCNDSSRDGDALLHDQACSCGLNHTHFAANLPLDGVLMTSSSDHYSTSSTKQEPSTWWVTCSGDRIG